MLSSAFFFCNCTLQIFSNFFLQVWSGWGCSSTNLNWHKTVTESHSSLAGVVFGRWFSTCSDSLKPVQTTVAYSFVLAQEEVEEAAGGMEETSKRGPRHSAASFFLLKMFIGLWPGSFIWHSWAAALTCTGLCLKWQEMMRSLCQGHYY